MRRFKVWIFDKESGCDQPITCMARNVNDAIQIGYRYIESWRLVGASITKVEEATV